MIDKWDERMMELARFISEWSKDPSTKVGAVLATPDIHIVRSVGYNGFPRRVSDDDRYHKRPTKYKLVVHAEANAILNTIVPDGCFLYVTKFPCSDCTKLIIQAGISRIVSPAPIEGEEQWRQDADFSNIMMSEAGIRHDIYEIN